MTETTYDIHAELASDLGQLIAQRNLNEERQMEERRFHDTCELITATGTPEATGVLLLALAEESGFVRSTNAHSAQKALERSPGLGT